eukprot:scaffold7936_cov135-Cylindrotheca_fusiformis.AAC.1
MTAMRRMFRHLRIGGGPGGGGGGVDAMEIARRAMGGGGDSRQQIVPPLDPRREQLLEQYYDRQYSRERQRRQRQNREWPHEEEEEDVEIVIDTNSNGEHQGDDGSTMHRKLKEQDVGSITNTHNKNGSGGSTTTTTRYIFDGEEVKEIENNNKGDRMMKEKAPRKEGNKPNPQDYYPDEIGDDAAQSLDTSLVRMEGARNKGNQNMPNPAADEYYNVMYQESIRRRQREELRRRNERNKHTPEKDDNGAYYYYQEQTDGGGRNDGEESARNERRRQANQRRKEQMRQRARKGKRSRAELVKEWIASLNRTASLEELKEKNRIRYPSRFLLNITAQRLWYEAHGTEQVIVIVVRDEVIGFASRVQSHCHMPSLAMEEEGIATALLNDAVQTFFLEDGHVQSGLNGQWRAAAATNTNTTTVADIIQNKSIWDPTPIINNDLDPNDPLRSSLVPANNNVILVSYEAMMKYKQDYIQELYKALNIVSDYQPELRDGNLKYTQGAGGRRVGVPGGKLGRRPVKEHESSSRNVRPDVGSLVATTDNNNNNNQNGVADRPYEEHYLRLEMDGAKIVLPMVSVCIICAVGFGSVVTFWVFLFHCVFRFRRRHRSSNNNSTRGRRRHRRPRR